MLRFLPVTGELELERLPGLEAVTHAGGASAGFLTACCCSGLLRRTRPNHWAVASAHLGRPSLRPFLANAPGHTWRRVGEEQHAARVLAGRVP